MMITEAVIQKKQTILFPEILTEKYSVRLAQTTREIESALRLRYEVFNLEMSSTQNESGIESDEFDEVCQHLIVVERSSGKTVGTYRLNTIESAQKIDGFYSFGEFRIENLPYEILAKSVEIGRACIDCEHRNTKVLFLLWKGLANFLTSQNKRYLFGCTSIFSIDPNVGDKVFKSLKNEGFLHPEISISPRKNEFFPAENFTKAEVFELPQLFNMYLKIGAKICGEPTIDYDFQTTDFFILFDVETLNKKYRKMFFGD